MSHAVCAKLTDDKVMEIALTYAPEVVHGFCGVSRQVSADMMRFKILSRHGRRVKSIDTVYYSPRVKGCQHCHYYKGDYDVSLHL